MIDAAAAACFAPCVSRCVSPPERLDCRAAWYPVLLQQFINRHTVQYSTVLQY